MKPESRERLVPTSPIKECPSHTWTVRKSEVKESEVSPEIDAAAFGAIESRQFPVSAERRLTDDLALLFSRFRLLFLLHGLDDVQISAAHHHQKREALPREHFFETGA